MYKSILLAYDGSPIAQTALHHAIALAAEQNARLRLVHVVDVTSLPLAQDDAQASGGLAAEMAAHSRRQAQALLERALATAKQAGVSAEISLLEGEVFGKRVSELLADEAKDFGADLVIVGSHGYRGWSRLFLGSVAEGVGRLCRVPVLIVHGSAPEA